MADVDATTMAEAEAEGGGQGGKKRSPIIMYIVIAVVMIAAGYFVGNFMSKPSEEGTKRTKKETRSKADEKESGHEGGQGEEALTPSDIYMIEDVIVNPAGTGGTRFLSVSIGFEVASDETFGLFEAREAIIKDALITILGSKTIQQLSDSKEKEITRYQIRKRIEHLLKVNDVSAVYFTDFILQ